MPLEPGTRLGPYEILELAGAGGMGEVYRARDTRLRRTVAIKVASAAVNADPQVRARFQREARAIAALNHPHICAIHDVVSLEGCELIVMEYLEGETLEQRLRRGPSPPQSSCRSRWRSWMPSQRRIGKASFTGISNHPT